MNKRGMLPLEVVVIAAILLVTMVVVIYFSTTKTHEVSGSISNCESSRGTCVKDITTECIDVGGSPLPTLTCNDEKKPKCCYIQK